MPETIEPWTPERDSRACRRRTLTEIGIRALRPFTRGDIDPATLEAIVVEALNFPIPLVEVEPGIFALELFHGPTLAFKDVGARVMARLMAALHRGDDPLTDPRRDLGRHRQRRRRTRSHGVPHTRVVDPVSGRPRQPDAGSAADDVQRRARRNVRAYAVAGSFDDCQRLTRRRPSPIRTLRGRMPR